MEITLYTSNPRNSTRKLLNTINKFKNIAGCGINLHSMNSINQSYRERNHIYNSIHDIASKKIKYIGINLIKEVKELYNEKFRSLKKERKTLDSSD